MIIQYQTYLTFATLLYDGNVEEIFKTIVHFKRLGIRVFHNSFYQYILYSFKQYAYCKTNAIYQNFQWCCRKFLMKMETSFELYNGKQTWSLTFCCNYLDTTNGKGNSQCSLFNTAGCKSKSWYLHKRRSPPFETCNLRNCAYQKDT